MCSATDAEEEKEKTLEESKLEVRLFSFTTVYYMVRDLCTTRYIMQHLIINISPVLGLFFFKMLRFNNVAVHWNWLELKEKSLSMCTNKYNNNNKK